MKLSELLAKLGGLPDAEKDKDAVDVLHNVVAADVFQPIFDRGHNAGLAKGSSQSTDLKTRAETAEAAAKAATEQLDEFKKKSPDAAKLQEQYQSDLKKKDEEHKAELAKRDQVLAAERTKRVRSDLVRELLSHKVDKDYAEVLADKPEVRDRIRFNDAGEIEVLQKGKDIAIVPSSEKGALAMLSEELKATVPAKFITSDATGGSGVGSENGTSAPSGDVFNTIREKEKKRNEEAAARQTNSGAAARFGIRQ